MKSFTDKGIYKTEGIPKFTCDSCWDHTNVSSYLLFHFSDEFEKLQGKEADCNLLHVLKADFHQKSLQIEMSTINYSLQSQQDTRLFNFFSLCM